MLLVLQWQIRWPEEGAGAIFVNGTEYLLKQCHWHSPSEHSINGRRYYITICQELKYYIFALLNKLNDR